MKPTTPKGTKGIRGVMRDGSLTETRLWRGGQTAMIAIVMWMVDSNFTSKAQFGEYKTSHQQWGEAQLNRIDEKLADLRRGQEAIELEIRTMNRRVRDAGLAK